ncbi:peptidyl-tRNA hydrolase-domain-containing protein [Cokeromyces recurvatus]|uniref:peptidyl-tRNA hydrolase-domain-containing protein n=1 Tax=Cokeromyces recurvatus TaxID=90255 RepID=UPI0022209EC2|nr:peptidyl-tRNA hydrolase-domain-containing protein [Cokeromyces recurvatus]KAI7899560.1 peptidyl-tRNA hydrolase-domain-containing protein [Cokeromyces recurvatus]
MNNTKILLVGLGNKTLPNTRHNVGMMVLDSIVKSLDLTWSQNRNWKSDTTETTIKVERKDETREYQVTFLKPRKLMNVSGSCVAKAVKDLGVSLQNLYVFHDDMQRDLGKVNLKEGGSANGHNGIKSVIENLKTHEFKRVRIGIGRPPAEIDDRSYEVVAGFVLAKFTQNEIDKLEEVVYPMWTKDQGLELLCDKGELIKKPKIKNKNKIVDPSKWEKNQQKKQNINTKDNEAVKVSAVNL